MHNDWPTHTPIVPRLPRVSCLPLSEYPSLQRWTKERHFRDSFNEQASPGYYLLNRFLDKIKREDFMIRIHLATHEKESG